jgi:hypothetical protein
MHPRKVSLKAPSGSQKCEQEKEKEMKFCKDCKWYRSPGAKLIPYWNGHSIVPRSFSEGEWCSNDFNGKTEFEPVHGKAIVVGAKGLEGLRKDLKMCGPAAKWFEEKEKSIPLCLDCKHSQECGQGVSTYYTCQKKIYHKLTGAYVSGSIWGCEYTREGEHLCGKYGKWFEKKEVVPPGTVIKFELVKHPKDKSQSWLCKLICGRKK